MYAPFVYKATRPIGKQVFRLAQDDIFIFIFISISIFCFY
jgi:hypothetical protein